MKKFGRKFKFRVTENLSGIDQITCSIDDKWILAEYEPKTNSVWGEIPSWIKGGEYEFKLIVSDHKKNRSEYKRSILLK